MNLPSPPPDYSPDDQRNMRNALMSEDAKNMKRLQDIRLENGERFILKSPNGTLYYLKVDNAGNLTTAAA